MAIALRAMEVELCRPELRVVSATSVFATPIPSGPVSIRVDVLRSGRAAAQVRAELTSDTAKGAGVHVLATFAEPGEGPDAIDTAPPPAPPPESLPRVDRPMPFFKNIDVRMVRGFLPEDGGTPSPDARCDRWIRYVEAPKRKDGRLDPLCLPAVADMMPTALWQKVPAGAPRLMAPSYDLTVHFLEGTDRDWLLTSAWCRRALGGHASADVEIWDDQGKLLAYGTQTMFFRKWPRRAVEVL